MTGRMARASTPGPAGRLLWVGGVAAAAALLAILHLATTFPYVALDGLAAFAEPEPFQRRALVPALAALLGQVGVSGPAAIRFLLLEAVAWSALVGVAWWLLGLLEVGLEAVERRLLALTVVVPVGVQLMLPARFRVFAGDEALGDLTAITEPFTRIAALPGLYFPYDVPAAVFLLALVGRLWRLADAPSARNWTLYGLLLGIGAANRETIVLVAPLSVWMLRRHLRPPGLAVLLAAHAGLVFGVTAVLSALLQAPPNPRSAHAGGAEWFLWTNLRTLAQPLYAATVLVPLAAGAWLPPLLWWRQVPPRLRAVVVLYTVPAFAAALVFGSLLETRVFTEVAASLWLVAAGTLLARSRRAM